MYTDDDFKRMDETIDLLATFSRKSAEITERLTMKVVALEARIKELENDRRAQPTD